MSGVTPPLAPFENEASQPEPDDTPHGRQCSRCQEFFEAEETRRATGPRGWWLCPACQITLIGEPRHRPASAINHPSAGH